MALDLNEKKKDLRREHPSHHFPMTSFLPLPLIAFNRRLMGANLHPLALLCLPFSRVPRLSSAAGANGRRTTGRGVRKREEASESLQMILSTGREGLGWPLALV